MLEYLPQAITFVFLAVVLSYYVLLVIRVKKPRLVKKFKSITVIIPAHNEERYIRACLDSVIKADFQGDKQIIVVDDGSIDRTAEIVSEYKGVNLVRQKHSGKSYSLNRGLDMSTGELVAVVDGDSEIHKDALKEVAIEVGRKNTVAATCPVRCKNRKAHINMWVHIELIYNALMRYLMAKVNANITTPGPLSVYRKKELKKIGGFSTEGFSEDVDVTIRLIRSGFRVGFAEKAIAETNMPHDPKGFIRQRTRFARGILNIFKRHLRLNRTIIDIYTFPIFLFTYMQAVVMGFFTIYQIVHGYFQWFVSKGIFFSWQVLGYFLDWTSIIGFVKWSFGLFVGTTPLNWVNAVGIIAGLLSYPLYFYAIFRFDRRFDIYHVVPILFMAPFWWLIMIINTICLPEMFARSQYNIWKKNEP